MTDFVHRFVDEIVFCGEVTTSFPDFAIGFGAVRRLGDVTPSPQRYLTPSNIRRRRTSEAPDSSIQQSTTLSPGGWSVATG